MKLQIKLVAQYNKLADAWRKEFHGLPFVQVCEGSIFDYETDAVVSPANSFGFMDGGIDYGYIQFFGEQLQEAVQQRIRDGMTGGELLVGAAFAIKTHDSKIPYLIVAPTMRVPMRLPLDTVNPYLATKAAIRAVLFQNKVTKTYNPVSKKIERNKPIETVSFPGMGTGVGRVPPELCARQMRAAVDEVMFGGDWKFPESSWECSCRHQHLYGDEIRDLQ